MNRLINRSRSAELDLLIEECWGKYFVETLDRLLSVNDVSVHRTSYAIFLAQVYYWAQYTGSSLAMAGAKCLSQSRLAKHFLRHAYEETGHHLLARHDLLALGVPENALDENFSPLAATRQLVAYVHWLATMENPTHLLGYDYWTENSFGFFQSQASTFTETLGLRADQMTFFNSHREIDKKHASDIQRMLDSTEFTDSDWREVKTNVEITIPMMIRIVDESIRESEKIRKGEPSDYGYFVPI